MKRTVLTAIVLMLLIPAVSFAVPQLINYQGKLTDSAGNPITGSRSIVFSLYNISTEGTPLWTETQTVINVNNGIFNVVLGSTNPLPTPLFDNAEVYLGIKVDTDAEMTPRQRITSAGYAFRAEKADSVKDGAITASKIGIVCADGYYLKYSSTGGWSCSEGTPGTAGPQGLPGTGSTLSSLGIKAGIISGTGGVFTQVTFQTPYPDTNYAIFLSGETYVHGNVTAKIECTYSEKTSTGFKIYIWVPLSPPPTVTCHWMSVPYNNN